MNKRITELAIEAGIYTNKSEMLHKFAELIIRECADIATLNQFQWDATGSYVLEHFDFEEKL